MSANTDTVRRFAAEFLGRADLAVADVVLGDNVIVHTGLSPAKPIEGRVAYKQIIADFADAFPVARMEIHAVLEAGADHVVLRFTAHATHAKEYFGVLATGRSVPMHEVHVIRLQDGRIVENHVGAVNLVFEMLMAPAISPAVLA